MNGKHAKTLRSIFARPTRANIEWVAVEALLVAIGCEAVEGSGSRVRFVFKGHVESFHRPHPDKEARRYQVREPGICWRKLESSLERNAPQGLFRPHRI